MTVFMLSFIGHAFSSFLMTLADVTNRFSAY
ncbi:hypothetical protein PPM_0721 [Paenibacillus polymyxa M1]|nr:hypothetical protein PPM_0721 [Paenibacillus polymyxa M1]